MTTHRYLSMVKLFGLYHAVAILPFCLPIVSEQVMAALWRVHLELELQGAWFVPQATNMMFVNLFACAAIVWALYRIRHASIAVGKYEGWAMLVFSLIVVYYVYHGASVLWLLIPLVDFPGGLLHLYCARNLTVRPLSL